MHESVAGGSAKKSVTNKETKYEKKSHMEACLKAGNAHVNYTNYAIMLTSGYACLYNYRWKG